MPTWLSIELALIPVLLSAMSGLVWLVRLEAQSRSNTKGVHRSDNHIHEGADVKSDIAVLKNDTSHIKEDIRDIKTMMTNGWLTRKSD